MVAKFALLLDFSFSISFAIIYFSDRQFSQDGVFGLIPQNKKNGNFINI